MLKEKKPKPHTINPGVPKVKPEVWYEYANARTAGNRSLQQKKLNELVILHEPLAFKFLSRFMAKWSQFGALPLDDMQQAARIGLMRAIQSNDTNKGNFAAWVKLWVRMELGKYAETYGVKTKKLPVKADVYRQIVDFEIKNGRIAEPWEMPHIPEKKLKDAQFRAHFCEINEDHATFEIDVDEELDQAAERRMLDGIDRP
jgi:DNA-directed RNA polymerase specialized sigma subunit